MKNQEISDLFTQIADGLEFKGENTFRVNAYRKAARVISELPADIETVAKEDKLQEIPGIGEGIANKVKEYLATGKMKKLAEATRGIPEGIMELRKIPGLGPKTLKLAYDELKVTNLAELRKAIKDGSLASLPMMGEKKVENIARGIALKTKLEGRMLLGIALPLVENIINQLKKHKAVRHISPAGSLRRMCETVGDIDILATGNDPDGIIKYFTQLPLIKEVLGAGGTKASVITTDGHQVDLRVVEESSYGAALQYFTGSKAHNIKLRTIAKDKGLKINEYGVFTLSGTNGFRGECKIAGKTEEEVYKALGLPIIPPEIREDKGEIEAARADKLPDLLEYNDLKGDFHCHTLYSDGHNKIRELADFARDIGYEYILITDHSKSAHYAGGLSTQQLLKQVQEIAEVNKRVLVVSKANLKGIRVLCGTEVDILGDGSIDFPDEILAELDIVVASIHSGFKHNVTERIIKAMSNPYVDIIAHPTGRLISTRAGYEGLDLEMVFKKAAETGTVLEINAFPDRLDLNDHNARRAKEFGVKFSIGTDTHRLEMLDFARLGIAVARRAWLTKKDIINARPWEVIRQKRKRG